MRKKHGRRLSLSTWLARIFRQPPPHFYGQASVYLSGRTLEIENFKRILSYEDGMLRVELWHGALTVYGSRMKIETLAAHRITLEGEIQRTEFLGNIQ